MAQVRLDELEDGVENGRADGLGVEGQALVCGTGEVVLIVGGILVLLRKEKEENGDDLVGSYAGEVVEGPDLIRALNLG